MRRGEEVSRWLAVLAVLVPMLGGGWLFAGDLGSAKQRIDTIEKRQEEDRRAVKETVQRIEDRVQRVDDNVTTILRKIDVMEERSRNQRREDHAR